MADLLWMPDVLRTAGLPVREVPGWQTRGHGAMGELLGVLCHHTAGPAAGNYPSERVVVDGRPGLEGPLCNLGLARDGTWIIVSNGQGWHAGTGRAPWCPTDQGNAHMIGVEAESTGLVDDWTPAQRESYPRGTAALLRHLGLGPDRAIGHKEWAPTRKIDPAFWDMTSFRADVARWMSQPSTGDDVNLTDRLPDLYTARPDDSISVGDSIAWAAAHAANARDAARAAATSAAQAAASTARIEAALAQLLNRPAVQLDPAAVQAAVVAALGGGLTITGTATPKGASA